MVLNIFLPVFIIHLYLLFGEMSVYVLCSFYNWTFFYFISVEFKDFFYILGSSPLLDMWFANIYFQAVRYLFFLLIGSFTAQKLLNFDDIQFTFSFMDCASGVMSNNLLPGPQFWTFSPVFSSESFTVLLLHRNIFKCDIKF